MPLTKEQIEDCANAARIEHLRSLGQIVIKRWCFLTDVEKQVWIHTALAVIKYIDTNVTLLEDSELDWIHNRH